jgi:vitamin B12 transporter
MKHILQYLPYIFSAITLCGSAQTTIKGKVTDHKKKPLRFANVFIKDSYDGTNTDSLGNYSFVASDTGKADLVFSLTGYEDFLIPLVLDGKEKIVNVPLLESATSLQEVVITAGSIEASDEKKSTVLKPLDIVTTAGAQGDIVGALKTLPGAQQVGESEGLFVRGGTNAETKTIIDGMVVNNFFYSSVPDIAQRARFSPFLFKGTVFSTGGYSSLYGQALSSVLVLETQDLPGRSSATAGISPLFASGGYSHLFRNQKASMGFDASYTNLTAYFAIIKQRPEWVDVPQSGGGSYNFRIKTSETGIIKFYSTYSWNHLSLNRLNIDSTNGYRNFFSLTNSNFYSILTFKEKIGKWVLNLGTSYSNNLDKISLDTNKIKSQNILAQGRVVVSRELPKRIMLRIGGEFFRFEDASSYNQYARNMQDNYSAGFAEADIKIKRVFVMRLGGRIDNSSLIGRYKISDRVSLAAKAGKHGSASFAYGNYYQKPENNYLWTNRSLDFEQCTHLILNYQYVTDSITLRTEVYYKNYNNFVRQVPVLNAQNYLPNTSLIPDTFNGGNGYARGLDVFYRDKKTFKGVDYWVSYTFLDTKRMYKDYPEKVRPTFAASHTASLVLKKFWVRRMFGAGLTYSYATGRPYYNPNNPVFLGDRTIDYHALGLNANLIRKIGKSNTVFVLAITNAIGNKQIFGYRYSKDGSRREEIGPTAARSIFLGMFMSFGIDRSKEVINNN